MRRLLILGLVLATGALLVPGTAAKQILPGIHKIKSINPYRSHADLTPLSGIIGKAEVVGLGEAIHTTESFSVAKFRLFRYLVEKEGFRAFGFESPWIDADRVARYVQDCGGEPEAAIRSLFGVWQSAAVRDLVQWMCTYNQEHPDDPVYFYGFDIQSQGGENALALREFLDRIGIPESDERSLWLANCLTNHVEGVAIPQTSYDRCMSALDRVLEHFELEEAAILEIVSREDLEWARIHAVGLQAWEDQIFYLDSDFDKSFEARDRGMAYVAEAIREIRFPEARTALWAHNAHVSKGRFLPSARSMGAFLKSSFKKRYKSIALIAYEASIDWPGFHCGKYQTAIEGSVEALLHDLGRRFLLVDLRFKGTKDKFLQKKRRYDINWGAILVPRKHFDALFYMQQTEKMIPLSWPACSE